MSERKHRRKVWSAPTGTAGYVTTHNHYLQTPVWADVRSRYDWRSVPVTVDSPELGKIQLFLYIRTVPGLGNVGYAPMWPDVFAPATLGPVVDQLKAIARKHGLFVIHLEPAVSSDKIDASALAEYGLRLTGAHIQYLATIVVDLHPSIEEIFAHFSATTRNEIRQAERRGLVCQSIPVNDANMALFHDMLRSTQARQNFYIRKKEFLFDYWSSFARAGQGMLYQTSLDGKNLTMAFVVVNGKRAFYRDAGALLDADTRRLAAPVFQQWTIIQDLKKQGVTSYDLCGALFGDAEDPTDPLWSIYHFKKRFNKQLTTYCGMIDLPISQYKYRLWLRGKHLFRRAYSALTGESWY